MSPEVAHVVRDGVAEIVLNRPERRNALTRAMGRSLRSALEQAARADDVRAVLLRGAGPSFCAGLDLADIAGSAELAEWMAMWVDIHTLLAASDVPVVVAAQGGAINAGAALALTADVLLVEEGSFLRIAEVSQGLAAPIGIAWLLLRHTPALARRVCLTGDAFGPAELLSTGLAHDVAPAGTLHDTARIRATSLAALPAIGVERTMAGLRAGQSVDVRAHFEAVLEASGMLAAESFAPERLDGRARTQRGL